MNVGLGKLTPALALGAVHWAPSVSRLLCDWCTECLAPSWPCWPGQGSLPLWTRHPLGALAGPPLPPQDQEGTFNSPRPVTNKVPKPKRVGSPPEGRGRAGILSRVLFLPPRLSSQGCSWVVFVKLTGHGLLGRNERLWGPRGGGSI